MTIRIQNEPDIVLTQKEYDLLRSEWEKSNMYTVMPVSFEEFVRSKKTVCNVLELEQNKYEYWWVIQDKDGYIFKFSCSDGEQSAKNIFCKRHGDGFSWDSFEKNGYRCVKIKVEVIGDEDEL